MGEVVGNGQRPSPVTVSFIVPAWNEERHVKCCLASLRAQSLPAWVREIELIVVDNQSTDGTAAVAESLGARVVTTAPGSASRARNAGAQAARGEWIAFVDADCELPPNWLEACSQHFEDATVVGVGATMRPPARGAVWVERCWYAIAHGESLPQAKSVRWLPSFNLLVRRDAFRQVNGFDERLVTCEDCDLGYRLSELGRLVLEPAAAVAHYGESQTLKQLFRREAWRSQGNLRLASARFLDWRNWMSLLLPVASVVGLVGLLILAGVALAQHRELWFWMAACLAVFLLPFVLLTARLVKRRSTSTLMPALVVFAVYLAARTAGLFISLPRVARTSER